MASTLHPRPARGRDGRALVLSAGRLVGIVAPSDVCKAVKQASLRSGKRPQVPG